MIYVVKFIMLLPNST